MDSTYGFWPTRTIALRPGTLAQTPGWLDDERAELVISTITASPTWSTEKRRPFNDLLDTFTDLNRGKVRLIGVIHIGRDKIGGESLVVGVYNLKGRSPQIALEVVTYGRIASGDVADIGPGAAASILDEFVRSIREHPELRPLLDTTKPKSFLLND